MDYTKYIGNLDLREAYHSGYCDAQAGKDFGPRLRPETPWGKAYLDGRADGEARVVRYRSQKFVVGGTREEADTIFSA